MPFDPFINYLFLLRSDIFGLLTLNYFSELEITKQEIGSEGRRGLLQALVRKWHIHYLLMKLPYLSDTRGEK